MTETPELTTHLTAAIDALTVGWKAESRANITATARYFFYEGVKAEQQAWADLRAIADVGSASEFGDALERLAAIAKLVADR